MNTVRKILVPIDFSEDSADGLNYAVSLAQKTQAELVALHVTQKEEADWFFDFLAMMEGYPMLNPPAGIPVDRLLSEKALDLYRFIEKVVRTPGQVKIRRKVALGTEAQKILGVVKEERIDLVVFPVRKTSFFPYLIARGKLLRTIARLPCPVLLKPSTDEPWPTSGILGPSIFAR
ncbi:MAG TPA: universal stress protein [Candidatus Binatia bacterium]|nr:universal stress protein [Candidatus Binatia bacterium]